jgi:signal transduction histidine kinase
LATRPIDRIADEQATLRRLATLVARGASPEDVFATVAASAGRLLDVDYTALVRYDPDDALTVVGTWARTGGPSPTPVGGRLALGGQNVTSLVFRTGVPARMDYAEASGQIGHVASVEWRLRTSVGVPISVEGRLWGSMLASSTHEAVLPADTELRLAGLAELVAAAVANAQARLELRAFAEEQAALRRVATLVARATAPEEVFAAVTAEVGRVLSADVIVLDRFDPDGTETVVGVWSSAGAPPVPVGTRVRLGGGLVGTLVFRTARPSRIDDYADVSGPGADIAREAGIRASVGVPVSVEGRLWGVMIVASGRALLPADIERRLTAFTGLVATAIANAQARMELRSHAEEQAALRRVATLVAGGAPAEDMFAAVTAEVGRMLAADVTVLSRYDPDDRVTIVSAWTSTGAAPPTPVGGSFVLGGQNVHTLVSETGRPARTSRSEASGAASDVFRPWSIRMAVGAPIRVEGRLWGVMSVLSTHDEPLPADTEVRLAGFTELVATALADAEAQAMLNASRARIVAAADATRRRIERDLHDGAQQRLVSLALHLRGTVRAVVPPEAGKLSARLDAAALELTGALDELRKLARGLHPSVLAEGGLRPALKALARRSDVPVRLDVRVDRRLPEQIELAAFYGVAESLTNSAKHASATVADVEVEAGDGVLRVRVRDDGRGGATIRGGSGLVEISDRVEALGGRLSLRSLPGEGTTVAITLPLDVPRRPGSSVPAAKP